MLFDNQESKENILINKKNELINLLRELDRSILAKKNNAIKVSKESFINSDAFEEYKQSKNKELEQYKKELNEFISDFNQIISELGL